MTQWTLADKYTAQSGSVYLTGTQALVRLPMMQRWRDVANGLNTAGYVSGYRGSPLGGLDRQMGDAKSFLDQHEIRFHPGVNEELAATAVWGSQQAGTGGQGKYDGVFALWYGKGPGVDRSGDAFRHGNLAGSSARGGVLVLMGDDHACESSTTCHQSEFALVDAQMPILSPAGVGEVLSYGLFGWSLSRYSGCWVGLKCLKDTIDASASVNLDELAGTPRIPDDFRLPPGGLNIRQPDSPQEQEARLVDIKLDAARAFVRANGLDRIVMGNSDTATVGIVTSGKSWLDLRQALFDLGVDEPAADRLGLAVFKVGMVWPLEPTAIGRFAKGKRLLIVIEEKRSLIESQLRELLYGMETRPLIIGKKDESGQRLFTATMTLDPVQMAVEVGSRLAEINDDERLRLAVAQLRRKLERPAGYNPIERSFYFCAGCPHNTSTRLPEGSTAYAGIGCSWMAQSMDRQTQGYTQMGGEGLAWVGEAPFSTKSHMFQNMGDGTYFHSGYLAVRAAIAAGTNITFKILYNDAVAMTGGQAHDGQLDPARISRQVHAEGAKRIAVVSDDPRRYREDTSWAPGVTIHPRSELDEIQRSLREVAGTSVLIYDQTCAAEKRRRRKRGTMPDPQVRVLINDLVCEGCGDCGVQSNCVAIVPLETEFGRKRTVDQSACNKDVSCLNGFCPSFVTARGGKVRRVEGGGAPAVSETPSEPVGPALCERPYDMVIAGVGGTGVVTIGAVLGAAAHIEGKGVSVLDMAGLAQKGGSVWTHVRFARTPADITAARIAPGHADLLLGCDLIVAASEKTIALLDAASGRAVVNTYEVMPGQFTNDPDLAFPGRELVAKLQNAMPASRLDLLDATALATATCGDSIAANLFLLGRAFQSGLIPLGSHAIERAIEINGASVAMNLSAFRAGRRDAHRSRDAQDAGAAHIMGEATELDLQEFIDRRARFLVDYQSARYADRYLRLVETVAARERELRAGSTALARAVATSFFKLLAYKDEYEVARLHGSAAFKKQLDAVFERAPRLTFHLAPPIFASKTDNGRPRKRAFGPWILLLFRGLQHFRFLRATPFDPFGYTNERKVERGLITEFEGLVRELIMQARPHSLDYLVEIVATPQLIRGFGPIKAANIERYRKVQTDLLRRWNGPFLNSHSGSVISGRGPAAMDDI